MINGSVGFGSCAHYNNDRPELGSVLVFFPKDFVWLCYEDILNDRCQEGELLSGVKKRDSGRMECLGGKGLNPSGPSIGVPHNTICQCQF